MIGCEPLDKVSYSQVLEAIDGPFVHRNRLLWVLGVATGLRISELLSLRIEDVFRSGTPVKRIRVQRRNTKGKEEGRSVILPLAVHPYIMAWLEQRAPAGLTGGRQPLFGSRNHTQAPISRVQAYRILATAFRAAGLDLNSFGTHIMRKTFAARVYEALDHNPVKLQRALGHRWISSTLAYISFDEQELDDAICRVSN